MLVIHLAEGEAFNNDTGEFLTLPAMIVEFEHSLVSLSKWESKHQKPFLGPGNKDPKDMYDYIECMVVSQKYPGGLITRLNQDQLNEITDYIQSAETATTFGEMPKPTTKGEIVTSELIYYWMVAFQIPFEAETWHLNRLLALIRICNIKNSKQKGAKVNRHEAAQERHRVNMERRQKYGTSG